MDLSETRDALTVLIGAGFVLIALLAFIGFARPQLQKLAKNTIWQVPQMGLKGLIGLLLFVQLCMVFAESLCHIRNQRRLFFPTFWDMLSSVPYLPN